MRCLLVALAVLTLLPSSSRADRIPAQPLPTDCPPGSNADIDHGGPHCGVYRCTDDSGCYAPTTACSATVSVCVVNQEFNTYRRRPAVREHAVGPCAADGTCAEGACVTDRFCVVPGAAGTTAAAEPTAMQAEPSAMEPGAMQVEPSAMEPATAMEPASRPTAASGDDAESGGCAASAPAGGYGWLVFAVFVAWRRAGRAGIVARCTSSPGCSSATRRCPSRVASKR